MEDNGSNESAASPTTIHRSQAKRVSREVQASEPCGCPTHVMVIRRQLREVLGLLEPLEQAVDYQ